MKIDQDIQDQIATGKAAVLADNPEGTMNVLADLAGEFLTHFRRQTVALEQIAANLASPDIPQQVDT